MIRAILAYQLNSYTSAGSLYLNGGAFGSAVLDISASPLPVDNKIWMDGNNAIFQDGNNYIYN